MKTSGDFGSTPRIIYDQKVVGQRPGNYRPIQRPLPPSMPRRNGFAGISYETGDFVTPGTSGLSGITHDNPDFYTPGTSGMGNILDSLLTPQMKEAAVESAKTTAINMAKFVWNEYKVPIILIGSYILTTMILSNVANVKTIMR